MACAQFHQFLPAVVDVDAAVLLVDVDAVAFPCKTL